MSTPFRLIKPSFTSIIRAAIFIAVLRVKALFAFSVAFSNKFDCSNLDSEGRQPLKIEETVAYHLYQKFLFRDT